MHGNPLIAPPVENNVVQSNKRIRNIYIYKSLAAIMPLTFVTFHNPKDVIAPMEQINKV